MFEEADLAITARLTDNWEDTEIDYENVSFTPTIGTAHIQLGITWQDRVQKMGGYWGTGVVELDIFVPDNTGTVDASVMADDLDAIFKDWSSGDLTFTAGIVTRMGSRQEWYQTRLTIPFKYNDC